ncbi:MAG: sulfur oxidation c-type cytochrome SoxX, partial [Gammaproteobacteria bacterium]|nr:sulfur oxidation c-type cytochrome SoxX [Gammaproteobacteria bacterium]
IAALLGSLALSIPAISQAQPSAIEEGKAIAFDRKKGNCLACHMIEGGSLPGNIGPPLLAMKDRFPDKEVLRSQIIDSRKNNPTTMMPPFGPHEVLSKAEIDKVVEFIYSL